MTARLWVGVACTLAASACGSGGGNGTCADIGGFSYTGTETLNGCGFTNRQELVTYEFFQTKNTCDITVATPLESCPGSIVNNTLTWTCPPISGITYYQATATLSTDLSTLNGSFQWTTSGCSANATTTLSDFKKN